MAKLEGSILGRLEPTLTSEHGAARMLKLSGHSKAC